MSDAAHPPSQARYKSRNVAKPQQRKPDDVPNRAPEPLNLAKPELVPVPSETPPVGV